MSYVTPITNRSAADLLAKNSKAYFNVADWARIYGNAQYVNAEIQTKTGWVVPFITATTPTTSSIPAVSDFNNLLANIEAMRQYVCAAMSIVIAPFYTLVWVAGPGNLAPSYIDVNQWESVIDQIKTNMDNYVGVFIRSGLGISGSSLVQSHRFRTYAV